MAEETVAQNNEVEQEAEGVYSGQFTHEDFKEWIVKARSSFDKAKSGFESDREYFENEQDPDNVPDEKEYIKDNRITDLVRRLTGQMISGKVNVALVGGGEMKDPVRMLFEDILDENDFNEYIMESIANHIYCEGYCGWSYDLNPMKRSKYGLMSPEINFLMPKDLWLDPDSRDLLHRDDNFRILPKQIPLKYAKKRWREHADAITESRDEYSTDDDILHYTDLYDIEFKETFLHNVGGVLIEEDKYFIVKLINETVVVEGPEETGYPCFRRGPFIHTPRTGANYGKYPMGPVRILAQTQNQLNVISSVMSEAVKKDIKRLAFISTAGGDTKELEKKYKDQAAKEHGVIAITGEARIDYAPQTGLAPSLIQMKEIVAHRFDEISGKFAPSRGEVSGDLSGRAIALHQQRDILSEYVAQKHIELGLTDLGQCIYYSIKNEMAGNPFSITREVDGQEHIVPFNVPMEQAAGDYAVPDEEAGVVNNLAGIDMKCRVEVEMNSSLKEQTEMNKAMIAFQNGWIAPIDALKVFYPKSYHEKHKNRAEYDQAMKLIQDMTELGPDFMNFAGQMIMKAKQDFEQIEGEENQEAITQNRGVLNG